MNGTGVYGGSAKLDFHWKSKKRSNHKGIQYSGKRMMEGRVIEANTDFL